MKAKIITLSDGVFFFFKFIYLIYLFLAVLGLFFLINLFIYLFIYFWLCWVLVSARGLSLVVASRGHSSTQCVGLSLSRPLVAEHRLQTRRLSNCGSRAQLLRGMWDPPRPGLEPVSPTLAGRLPTTAPPGKPFVGSLLLHMGFLYLQRAGTTLPCSVQASHCGGFSCCGAQALGAQASVAVARGLSSCGSRALEHRLSSCCARA